MTSSSNKKIGVLSHVLPPSPSGQSMVLFRLFSGFSRKRYCLISSGRMPGNGDFAASEGLDADLFQLRKVRKFPPVSWAGLSALFTCINIVWVVLRRSRQI